MEHVEMYRLLILEEEVMDGRGPFFKIWQEKRVCQVLLIFMTLTDRWQSKMQ